MDDLYAARDSTKPPLPCPSIAPPFTAKMTISKELLDELLKGCERPEDLLGDAGLMKEQKIKLMERMPGAELTAHLGYEEGRDAPPGQPNRRNGTACKSLKGQDGEVPISVPRDRAGSFEPELVKKGQTRIDGMDDKIIHCPAGDCTAICREGAKFWLSVMNELKNRGVQDILIAVVDGLKGFPEAITAAFPEATVQTCIVHLVRHSLNFCAWKDRKAVAADLRPIYGAATADLAAAELDAFEEKWAGKYASIAPAWRRAWQEVIPFFAFDPAIRKIIYTTNAIESLNRVIRKPIKTRGSFPTEEAATKLIYLAIRNFQKGGRNFREWFAARNQFAIMFEERFYA